MSKLSNIDREDFCKRVQSGESYVSLCNLFGVSDTTVRNFAKSMGICRPRSPKYVGEARERAHKLIVEGVRPAVIAQRTGLTRNAIIGMAWRMRQKAGVGA